MNRRTTILLTVGVVVVVGVGILASVVGNVGIRRVQPNQDIQLIIAEPVVLGVPTSVRWSLEPSIGDRPIELQMRASSGALPLASARLYQESTTVVFPCSAQGTTATLNMIDDTSGELLTWQQVRVLPPGQDCF